MVAASVIRTLATDLSVRVGALAPIATALFELCNASPWPVLERTKVIINLQEAAVRFAAELEEVHSDQPLIIISLREIVAHLREQLLAGTDHVEQPSLRFPPTPIACAATAQRGRP